MKRVSAEYVFYPPSSMSIDDAKREAIERAKLQALADAFGTRIVQTSNTQVSNDGEKSNVSFFSSGANEVMGEWIENEGEPKVEITYNAGMLVVKVFVKGKARQITKQHIMLNAKVLRNNTDDKSESDVFYHGDSLYLSFQSPVNGSLLIYLKDYTSGQVFRLLPYASSEQLSYDICQNKRYLFFSEKDATENSREEIDQYSLTCNGKETERNEIIILFSPEKLIKENSSRVTDNLPQQLSEEEFGNWLAKLKVINSNLYVINKLITIKPTQS